MKRYLYLFLVMAACLLSSSSTKAWGCNNGDQRYDVGPTAPAGSTAGDNQGQYYKGPDSGNNDYWVCEPKGWTPPSTTTGQGQNQTQTQSQTANGGSSTSKSGSTSGASATSNPVVTAKGGNATGGSVSNSGNSSNTNKTSSSATGGAGGSATSSSSNNSTGSGNNTEIGGSTYSTRVEAAASTADAFANSVYDCTKGVGAGAQTIAAGATLSFGHADKTCQDLKIAESLYRTGSDDGYCTAISNDKQAKKLGVTYEKCMNKRRLAPVIIHEQLPAPAPVQQPPVVVLVPQQTPVAAIPVVHHNAGIPAGDCKVYEYIDNVCAAFLGTTLRQLQGDVDGVIIVKGNGHTASLINNWLDKHQRLYHSRYHLSVTDEPSATVQFTFVGSAETTEGN